MATLGEGPHRGTLVLAGAIAAPAPTQRVARVRRPGGGHAIEVWARTPESARDFWVGALKVLGGALLGPFGLLFIRGDNAVRGQRVQRLWLEAGKLHLEQLSPYYGLRHTVLAPEVTVAVEDDNGFYSAVIRCRDGNWYPLGEHARLHAREARWLRGEVEALLPR